MRPDSLVEQAELCAATTVAESVEAHALKCTSLYNSPMTTYSLSEARANLPLILNKVENGEEITITRHGRPAAVIVGHDRWMKTARLDVLEQARELRRRMDALKDQPFTGYPVIPGYDAEAHIAWNRDREEPWDRVERELRELREKGEQ